MQYNTEQEDTIQNSKMQCSTIQDSTVQHITHTTLYLQGLTLFPPNPYVTEYRYHRIFRDVFRSQLLLSLKFLQKGKPIKISEENTEIMVKTLR